MFISKMPIPIGGGSSEPNKVYILKNGTFQHGYTLREYHQSSASPSYTAGTGIKLQNTSTANTRYRVGTNQAIDVTDYSKMVFVVNGNKQSYLGLDDSQFSDYGDGTTPPNYYVHQNASGTYTLDVSSLTGNKYLAMKNALSEVNSAIITDIYFEF